MNELSSQEVVDLPLSEREKCHQSRTRRGFHVYLSRFFTDFYCLDEQEKAAALLESMGVLQPEVDVGSDVDSIDSTDTPIG